MATVGAAWHMQLTPEHVFSGGQRQATCTKGRCARRWCQTWRGLLAASDRRDPSMTVSRYNQEILLACFQKMEGVNGLHIERSRDGDQHRLPPIDGPLLVGAAMVQGVARKGAEGYQFLCPNWSIAPLRDNQLR